MAKTPRHSRPSNEPSSPVSAEAGRGTDPRRGKHARASGGGQADPGASKRTIVIVVAAMLALCIAGVAAWFLLFAESDADRIQGTWRVPGAKATIEVTQDRIVLTDDVSYAYSLDPFNHTMGFSFFGAEGSAVYALTHEGNMLTITETLARGEGEHETKTLVLVRPGSEAERECLEGLEEKAAA